MDFELRHDDIVSLVEKRLRDDGLENIVKFEDYSSGEIDIYAIQNDKVLLFEIKTHKTTKGYKKALIQLDRAEYSCFKGYEVYKFFVYATTNKVVYEWQKRKK